MHILFTKEKSSKKHYLMKVSETLFFFLSLFLSFLYKNITNQVSKWNNNQQGNFFIFIIILKFFKFIIFSIILLDMLYIK